MIACDLAELKEALSSLGCFWSECFITQNKANYNYVIMLLFISVFIHPSLSIHLPISCVSIHLLSIYPSICYHPSIIHLSIHPSSIHLSTNHFTCVCIHTCMHYHLFIYVPFLYLSVYIFASIHLLMYLCVYMFCVNEFNQSMD